MPVLCLAIFSIASGMRQTRSSMLEVIQQDYIRTAWAKGLKERVIIDETCPEKRPHSCCDPYGYDGPICFRRRGAYRNGL